MYEHSEVLFVIMMIFNCLLVNARSSLYNVSYENVKVTKQLTDTRAFGLVEGNNTSYRSIRKRDAFDDLLDIDIENDMDIYRDVLVDELVGADRTLLDRKLDEAENIRWARQSAFHTYAMQIFDEIKRYHSVRSKITDYNF